VEIAQSGNFAIVSTEESFVIIVHEKMYGPFPNNSGMYEKILQLLDGVNQQLETVIDLWKKENK
jgi:hypothetical protein